MHHRAQCCCKHVTHRIECRHQIEIEVFPGSAEVYFADEQYAAPEMGQARFDATVINAPTARVHWSVQSPLGGPGKGSIDETGLYVAPQKGGTKNGWTDVVVASPVDDPLRRAMAFVTLIGRDAEPVVKRITISPRRCTLYYPRKNTDPPSKPAFDPNRYVDPSNSCRIFTAVLWHANEKVLWTATGVGSQTLDAGQPYFYPVTGSGGAKTVRVRAELVSAAAVFDEAIVSIIDYDWPNQQRSFEV
jgi:hypothetical protein